MIVTDWSKYAPYFNESEFRCSHTGRCEMQKEFMDRLYILRAEYNKPMTISSGFRHRTHPIEARKTSTGEHPQGLCADIRVYGADALDLLELALRHGFRRIGVNQKGNATTRFIHIGVGSPSLPTPAIWTY
jgi:zinc D-Ala-D-Ala carboxypeptidase